MRSSVVVYFPLSLDFRFTSTQDMIAEAMRVGLSEAKELFAAAEGDSGGDTGGLGEGGTRLKAERGKAEGAVLGLVRSALASR